MLKISRVLHAGYCISSPLAKILIDPIFENPFSVNCFAFPSVQFDLEALSKERFDAVLISHYHDDHFSLESLKRIHRETAIYVFCLHEEAFSILKQMGFKKVFPVKLDQHIQISDFRITFLRSLDRFVDSLIHVESQNINVLNVVDSWIDDEMLGRLSLIKWDLVLWPFQTMRELEVLSPKRSSPASADLPIEWKNGLSRLKPKVIVPSSCQFKFESWSWLNHHYFPISYEKFALQVHELLPAAQVIKLNPSQGLSVGTFQVEKTADLKWVRVMSNSERADYDYDSSYPIQSTNEISQFFPPLNEEETLETLNFCLTDLAMRYNQLQLESNYFSNNDLFWKLTLYNNKGFQTQFHYCFQKGQITSVAQSDIEPESVFWTTEISQYKLYWALKGRETLTSLYIRINEFEFSEPIENELSQVDVLEDPLLAALYSFEVLTYQKFQLSNLHPP
jgi:hypothetical protein